MFGKLYILEAEYVWILNYFVEYLVGRNIKDLLFVLRYFWGFPLYTIGRWIQIYVWFVWFSSIENCYYVRMP